MTTVKTLRRTGALALTAIAAACALTTPASAGGRTEERIVRLDAATTEARGKALVRQAGGKVTRDLHLIHALGARLTGAEARRLARTPGIDAVQASAPVTTAAAATYSADKLATAYNQSTKVDKVWSSLGGTGKGVGVAVIDTGIAGGHPDFASPGSSASRVIASVVTNPDATTATDTYGHGTHVAGLIAGNGWARPTSDPLYGRYAGAAPDANLISIKVSDDRGAATLLDVIYGIQFAVDNMEKYGIRIVNLSLNSTVAQSYRTDPLNAAVEEAWFRGLVVVAAAGNRGEQADATHYAPANDPYAIAVGAADDQGTKSLSDDALASWSSRGVTQDGFLKPDVIAPGARLVSTVPAGSDFLSLCPSCVRDGQYFQAGGTSMAAAVVSGVAASILQVKPRLTPDQVKTALMRTFRTVAGMGHEVAADQAAKLDLSAVEPVNLRLTANELIDPSTGGIDYSRASWSRASWSEAAEMLRASWSRASWSCRCSRTADGSIDPSRASWSRASWSTAWSY